MHTPEIPNPVNLMKLSWDPAVLGKPLILITFLFLDDKQFLLVVWNPICFGVSFESLGSDSLESSCRRRAAYLTAGFSEAEVLDWM